MKLDVNEVRRYYLSNGCDTSATAEHFGASRQAIHAALKRANASHPLTYQSGEPEDQRAMTSAVRHFLDGLGIARR